MPLSRMENTTFAMPSIILSRYGIEDCLQSRRPKENAYSTPMGRRTGWGGGGGCPVQFQSSEIPRMKKRWAKTRRGGSGQRVTNLYGTLSLTF
ncbi:hypothetical protein TNCV_3617341 [Trichonephila clavipes]|nr:hypothetical protein TNCV_3617341 [Trichonephila clavipes]